MLLGSKKFIGCIPNNGQSLLFRLFRSGAGSDSDVDIFVGFYILKKKYFLKTRITIEFFIGVL